MLRLFKKNWKEMHNVITEFINFFLDVINKQIVIGIVYAAEPL